MGIGKVAALHARASEGEVRGHGHRCWERSQALQGECPNSPPPPPGSCHMPVQGAVSSCVTSSPELQFPTQSRAAHLSKPLEEGCEGHVLCAGSSSSAKPQHPQEPGDLVAVLGHRPLSAVVAAPSGGCSGDYSCPLGAGHGIALAWVSANPGLSVGRLPPKPLCTVPA